MQTYVIIYLKRSANLTSRKGPHMTKSTLIVPEGEFSQCKLLAQYPVSEMLHPNECTLAKYGIFIQQLYNFFY